MGYVVRHQVNQGVFRIVVYTDKGLPILSLLIWGMKKNPYDFVVLILIWFVRIVSFAVIMNIVT